MWSWHSFMNHCIYKVSPVVLLDPIPSMTMTCDPISMTPVSTLPAYSTMTVPMRMNSRSSAFLLASFMPTVCMWDPGMPASTVSMSSAMHDLIRLTFAMSTCFALTPVCFFCQRSPVFWRFFIHGYHWKCFMSSVGVFKTQSTDELLVRPTVNPQQSVVPRADIAGIVRSNNNYCGPFSGVVIETSGAQVGLAA